jgi:hypothetical protein
MNVIILESLSLIENLYMNVIILEGLSLVENLYMNVIILEGLSNNGGDIFIPMILEFTFVKK